MSGVPWLTIIPLIVVIAVAFGIAITDASSPWKPKK